MNGSSLHGILRNTGYTFGGGAGFLVAALVLVLANPDLMLISIVLAAGGGLLWAAFAAAVLALIVELAEGIPTRTAARR